MATDEADEGPPGYFWYTATETRGEVCVFFGRERENESVAQDISHIVEEHPMIKQLFTGRDCLQKETLGKSPVYRYI